jgi:hypothetical protein
MDLMDGGGGGLGLATVGAAAAAGIAASDNPVADSAAEEGKQDGGSLTAVMPDHFSRVRALLCRADGSPRLLVWLMPWAWLVVGVVTVPLTAHWTDCTGCEDEEATGRSLPHAVNGIAFALAGTAPATFPLQLYRAVAPLEAGGALARLGVGTAKVSERQLRSAKRWLRAIFPVALLFVLYPLVGFFVTLLEVAKILSGEVAYTPGAVMMPWVMLCLGLGMPCMLGWYVAMKVGVALAHNDVMAVVAKATPAALADDEQWSGDVARPAVRLATHTMRDLSDGFGAGTALVALVFSLLMLFNGNSLLYGFTTGYHIHFTEDDPAGTGERVSSEYSDVMAGRHAFNLFCCLFVPLLLASDLAYVSSLCDALLNTINNLRLRWESVESAQAVHLRVYPLLDTLRNLNNNQGCAVRRYRRLSFRTHRIMPYHCCVVADRPAGWLAGWLTADWSIGMAAAVWFQARIHDWRCRGR